MTVEIRSNIAGRLKKIRKGVVYQSVTSVLGELGQNSQRAGATEVDVTLVGDQLIFEDNGKGCDDPQTVFELDTSGWGISEAFGEGFSSVFAIADKITVVSHGWQVDVDVEELMRTGNFQLEVRDISPEFLDGFRVELRGKKIQEHEEELLEFLHDMGSLMPQKFRVNGVVIEKKDLTDIPGAPFTVHVDNEFYSGTLAPYRGYWYLNTYYESRFVNKFWHGGLQGNITFKPEAVTLKAPDRRDLVMDDKYWAFREQLRRDSRKVYIEALQHFTEEQLHAYSEFIDQYLTVEDYMDLLPLDESIYDLDTYRKTLMDRLREAQGEDPESIDYDHATEDENLEMADGRDEEDQTLVSHPTAFARRLDERRKKSRKVIKKLSADVNRRRVCWIRASEITDMDHQMRELEYYGIRVVVAKNLLYENVYSHLGIPHISEVQSSVESQFEISNVGLATLKERRFMSLLEKIEQHYGMKDLFRIADLTLILRHHVNGKEVSVEKKRIAGLYRRDEDGVRRIYLDRREMQFERYKVQTWDAPTIGLNDLRFLLRNAAVIAHELAHCLYDTMDGTTEHFEKTEKLIRELGDIFG